MVMILRVSGWLYFSFHAYFLQVTYKEEHISFFHFMTNVCALIGGNIKPTYCENKKSFFLFSHLGLIEFPWVGNTWQMYYI